MCSLYSFGKLVIKDAINFEVQIDINKNCMESKTFIKDLLSYFLYIYSDRTKF